MIVTKLYLIGALKNPDVPEIANELEDNLKIEIFTDWFSPGPEADDRWRDYCKARGWTYTQALQRPAATHVFEFDKSHIDSSDGGILILPAGKSCALELGYILGQGKPGWVLLDDPERWEVMWQFATGITDDKIQLMRMIHDHFKLG